MKPYICEISIEGALPAWFRVKASNAEMAAAEAVAQSSQQGILGVAVYTGHSMPWPGVDTPVLNRTLEVSVKPLDQPDASKPKRGDAGRKIQGWLKHIDPT